MNRVMLTILVAVLLAVPTACKRGAPAADAAAAAPAAAPAAAEASKVPDPVATVNGKAIGAAAFTAELDKITQGGARAIPEDRLKKIQENILNRLVEEELLGQEVATQGVAVLDTDLDAEFAKYKERFKSDEQFNNYLTHGKTTVDEIRGRLKTSLSLTKLLEKLGKLEVADEEVRKAYESGIKLYTEPEQVQAVHVLIKVAENAPQDKVDAAKKRAQDALKKIKGGADFGAVAKEYSEDAMTKEKGGDLGFFRKGVMVPKFEEAAFALKVGEVTKEPVRTPFGFHVIKVTERKAERVKPFDEVKDQIRESLRNRNTFKARRELVESLKAKAKLEVFLPK
jgi:parvulin-like peptidyl-prolyl isomerase